MTLAAARYESGAIVRGLQIGVIALAALFLAAVVALIAWERSWVAKEPSTPEDYFRFGSTGTEIMPLAVLQVLPTLFPENFQPGGAAAGDWIDQFGFVRGRPGVNEGLPLGVNISRYRPKSGAPYPIPMVGFNCAVCHSAKLTVAGREDGTVVLGMANAGLDLVAFGEAVKSSVLDEKRLTMAAIETTYEGTMHNKLGLTDKLAIKLWLDGVRPAIKAEFPMRGHPYGGADIRNPEFLLSGPGRNEPMKETVRFLIHQTPEPTGGSSKIPALYRQDRRHWAQFDGSLGDPLLRNSLAALGVGASLDNLRMPGILNTIHETYTFVRDLEGPRFAETVGGDAGRIDTEHARGGAAVYAQYCTSCHGAPTADGKDWSKGQRQGDVIAQKELGTDPARVTFRFYGDLKQIVYDYFPEGHPLKPQLADMRAEPEGARGFVTEPLESVFSRGPYLHNGSVPTLAQLINLVPRPNLFYRGASELDPVGVGIVSPAAADAKHYYRFDTAAYGNSNRGHDYPWAYRGPGWNDDALKDLLEYLKTF